MLRISVKHIITMTVINRKLLKMQSGGGCLCLLNVASCGVLNNPNQCLVSTALQSEIPFFEFQIVSSAI